MSDVIPAYLVITWRTEFGCAFAAATHSRHAARNAFSSAGLDWIVSVDVQNAPTGRRYANSLKGLPSERKPPAVRFCVRNGSWITIASRRPPASAGPSSAGDIASALIDFGSPPA